MAVESKAIEKMTNPELRNGIEDLEKLIEWKKVQISGCTSSDTNRMGLLNEDLTFHTELKKKYEKKLSAKK